MTKLIQNRVVNPQDLNPEIPGTTAENSRVLPSPRSDDQEMLRRSTRPHKQTEFLQAGFK